MDNPVELVRRVMEEFDAPPSVEVVDRWMTPGFLSHQPGGVTHDLSEYRESLAPFIEGFTDIRHVIRETVVEGNRITLFIDVSLTHTGASGRPGKRST